MSTPFPRPGFGSIFILCAIALPAQTDPHLTSWLTTHSGRYARVWETASDKSSNNAVNTWPRAGLTNGGGGQSTPAYSDVQRVAYSANYVYLYTSGLASYTMGYWLTPTGQTYTSWPTNRGAIHRIPRNPTIPTTKQKTNGSGGVLVNGVFVWANGDAQSYTTSTGTVSMQGQGVWNRLAGVAEAFNFDSAYGHQPNNGAYHNHVNPIALRYQLGDNVTYNAGTKTYSEAATLTKHSPLIGWANDGLPIYGPYGYSSPLDPNSGIRRMVSGFQKRDGTNGTTNLATTGRKTLPVWAASVQGRSQALSVSEYGPNVTATYQVAPGLTGTYSLGMFAEDYEYLGDVGKVQGVDFDLNRQNVRYGVTPEYPNGTYAYFVSIDASGATVFPDIINQEFFGSAPMGQGTVTSIAESVSEYVRGGPAAAINVTAAASGDGVALSWNSAEGATYRVESSPNNTSWTTLVPGVTSAGLTTNYTAGNAANYYRVTLTAIATYDTKGTFGTAVGTAGTVTYGTPVIAPAISTQPTGASVTAGGSATFSVSAGGTAPLSYQWKKDGATISGATATSYAIAVVTSDDAGSYTCVVSNSAGSATSNAATLTVTPVPAPTVTALPVSPAVTAGGSQTFTVTAGGPGPFTYQWSNNGVALDGATAASLTLANVQPANTGIYSVAVSNASASTSSVGEILGVATSSKVIGLGEQVGADIVHPNGRIYDQVLLQGAAATVTADAGQVVRVSFVDLTDDIVQIEFAGAGSLSLVLDNASGPATAGNYNQSTVNYMKGHARIVIVGADETTNVSVFSVGRATAVNQALFKDGVTYDGMADLAFIAIASTNGKFGGVRTADASFYASKGLTGIYAPGVEFTGPVYVGELGAFDAATPVLQFGGSSVVQITGGNLAQPNAKAVQVSGITQLGFVDGTDSHGNLLAAGTNRARLEQNGADVTAQIVVNP